MEVQSAYEFKQVTCDQQSIKNCNELLKVVFPESKKFSEQFLSWEYADNPVGEIIGFNAFKGEVLAAHYVTQPLVAIINGDIVKGLLSLNTATHPDHQGKKLFISLAEKTYEYAAANGFSFVIGVANANSTPGFLKKLGFQHVCPLDVKVGSGKIKKNDIKSGPSYQRLWDERSLQWRLSDPFNKYLVHNSRVYSPNVKMGIRAIMGEFDATLLKQLYPVQHVSCSPVKMYIGRDSSINWKKSCYINLPDRFKTSPLNLIFKDLTGNGRGLSKDDLCFQLIDFDAY